MKFNLFFFGESALLDPSKYCSRSDCLCQAEVYESSGSSRNKIKNFKKVLELDLYHGVVQPSGFLLFKSM